MRLGSKRVDSELMHIFMTIVRHHRPPAVAVPRLDRCLAPLKTCEIVRRSAFTVGPATSFITGRGYIYYVQSHTRYKVSGERTVYRDSCITFSHI